MTSSKRFHLLLFTIAILFAFLTTLIFMKQVSSWKTNSTGQQKLKVIVVTRAVPEHSVVGVNDVDVEEVPQSALEANAVSSLGDVVGRFTSSAWFPGQQVISQMVLSSDAQAAFPLKVPTGDRAFSIPDDVVVGVDHLISPGDHVDVLATYTDKTSGGFAQTILQDALVLNVDNAPALNSSTATAGGQSAGSVGSGNTSPGGAKTDTLTIAVTPTQAETLVLAENYGQLHASLRHPGDDAVSSLPVMHVNVGH